MRAQEFAPQDAARNQAQPLIAVMMVVAQALACGCASPRTTDSLTSSRAKEILRESAKDVTGDDLGEFSTQRGLESTCTNFPKFRKLPKRV